MDTELKRFLHDQRCLKRGLPPAQWTPLKQPVPKPVNSTPRSALASKAPLTRVQKKLARDRQRTATHLARQGIEYQVRPSPLDTGVDLIKLQPQMCRECGNAKAGRELLSPGEGRFFTNHNGTRWVCDRCVKLYKMPSLPSPGEKRLADLLLDHHINFLPQHVLHGRAFDFYIPQWNVIVEVDSWSAHHTAVQKKKDYWRDKIAKRHGIHLLRVNWKDRKALDKIMDARTQGKALCAKLGGS